MHYIISTLFFCISVVMVSIPLDNITSEGDGSVMVCVMLNAMNDIERDAIVTLTTVPGTGKNIQY